MSDYTQIVFCPRCNTYSGVEFVDGSYGCGRYAEVITKEEATALVLLGTEKEIKVCLNCAINKHIPEESGGD